MPLSKEHALSFRWFGLVAAWLLLDQATKHLAVVYLKPVGSVQLIGDLLRLTYAENRGMAFSISFFPPWFLSFVAIIAAIVLIIQLWRHPEPVFRNFSLSLILAGAIGNVFDRLRFGYVIDFIDSDFPNFIMNRWPVFNFADSGITVGVILFGIYTIFEKPKDVVTPTNVSQPSTPASDNPA